MAGQTVTVTLLANVAAFVAGMGSASASATGLGGALSKSGAKAEASLAKATTTASGVGNALASSAVKGETALAKAAKATSATTAKAAREAESAALKRSAALTSVGNAAGVMGVVAGVAFVSMVAKAAEFDSAMSNVQAATGMATESMGPLREAALQAGADTVFSASQAASGMEELSKAGVSTADILGGGLTGALDLAAAGQLEVGDAAEISASALTQFNLQGADVPHIADLLAAGAGKAQGSVTDMGAALNQTGLVASQLGFSIEETTGTLAMFASAGLTGSDAGTSMKTMLMRLANPTAEANAEMEKYGISLYDSNGELKSMAEIAGDVQTGFKGVTAATRNAAMGTIFGADAIRAANLLYRNGAKDTQAWVSKVNDAGYASRQAAMRMDNLKGDLENLGGAFETALIGTGEGSAAPLRALTGGLTDLVNVYNKTPEAVKAATFGMTGLVSVLGLGGFAATRAISGYVDLKKNLQTLIPPTSKLGQYMSGLTGKTLALKAGAGLAGAGLVAFSSTLEDGGAKAVTQAAGWGLMAAQINPLLGAGVAATSMFMSMAGANDSAETSIAKLNDTVQQAPGDFAAMAKGAATAQEAVDVFAQKNDAAVNANWNQPGAYKNWVEGIFGKSDTEELQEKADAAKEAADTMRAGMVGLRNAVSDGPALGNFARNLPEITVDLQRMAPAVGALGFTMDKLALSSANVDATQGTLGGTMAAGIFDTQISVVKAYMSGMDSLEGKTRNLVTAFASLDAIDMSTADSANLVAQALGGIVGPELNASQANDVFAQGLDHMSEGLNKNNKSLTANNDAGRQNRDVIRQRTGELMGMLSADAAAGMGTAQLTRKMEHGRDAIMKAGVAAGLNKAELRGLLETYNLTPKLINTLIRAQNIKETKAETKELVADYNSLPKDVRMKIKADGLPETRKGIKDLGHTMGLTEKEIDILLRLHGSKEAQKQLQKSNQIVKKLDGEKAEPKITVDGKGFMRGVATATAAVKRAGRLSAHPKITAETKPFIGDVRAATNVFDIFGRKKASPNVNVTGTESSTGKVKGLGSLLDTTGRKRETPQVDANVGGSVGAIQGVINAMNNVPGNISRSITITTIYRQIGNALGAINPFDANGGEIHGPGGPRDDMVPINASDGEFIVNAGATKRNLALLHAINGNGFKDGGEVTAKDRRGARRDIKKFNVEGKDSASETRSELNTLLKAMKELLGKDSKLVKHLEKMGDRLMKLSKAQDKAQKAYEKANQELKESRKESRDYAREVAEAFKHDAFSGSAAESIMQLKADRNDANEAAKDLREAKRKGLDGDLLKELAASGNTELIDQVSNMSRKEIAQYERLLKQRKDATQDVGNQTAKTLFGENIRKETVEVRKLHHAVDRLNKKIERIEHAIERGARKGTHKGSKDGARESQRHTSVMRKRAS